VLKAGDHADLGDVCRAAIARTQTGPMKTKFAAP
jgi:hypothetical protein